MIRKPGGLKATAGLPLGGAAIAASTADSSDVDGSVIVLLRRVRRASIGVASSREDLVAPPMSDIAGRGSSFAGKSR
jgi:hypothetical protein